jgi:hypothetical protein
MLHSLSAKRSSDSKNLVQRTQKSTRRLESGLILLDQPDAGTSPKRVMQNSSYVVMRLFSWAAIVGRRLQSLQGGCSWKGVKRLAGKCLAYPLWAKGLRPNRLT